jgi:nitrite reductase (NADH) large subunit
VKDPARRAKFKQFVNTDDVVDKDDMIEFVDMRGQLRPADWPKDGEVQTNWKAPPADIFANSEKSWVCVGKEADFAANVGSQVLYGDVQLAVFNNKQRGEWYCTQNMCPHKQAFVLSQGIIGDAAGAPKVACPLHKKQFGLESGAEINGGDLHILTFPVDLRDGKVFVELPSIPELDAILGTNGLRVKATSCIDIAGDAIKIKTKGLKTSSSQRLVETATRLKETALKATGTNSTEAE